MVNYDGLISQLHLTQGPFALLTNQATSTTGRLKALFPDRFKCLFSAEHGFYAMAAPGEKTLDGHDDFWDLPYYSLYGEHRKPTPAMLTGLKRVIVDLCDIGVRCYTYLATLGNVLEACAEQGVAVTVLDREIPLGGIVDGPMRRDDFSSFVAPYNVPLCHGMTPGECAYWIAREKRLELDLSVVRLLRWNHAARAPWPNFVPPSPGIRTWDSAALYPMTLFTEAYPAVDCDRAGPLSFRILGAPWLDRRRFMADLAPGLFSCGVAMRPYRYQPGTGTYAGKTLDGVLFTVMKPEAYYPVTAGTLVFASLMSRHAAEMAEGARPEWLDKLTGSSDIRAALAAGDLEPLFHAWIAGQDEYLKSRVNLY